MKTKKSLVSNTSKKRILLWILIPGVCLVAGLAIILPICLTRCNDNKNVSVNLITSNGEANLKTTTALTLAFNGSNAIQNLVGTDFSITGENGSGTDVTIASVSSADGHTYIINIKGIIEEGEKVKIIVNDIAGYKIAQYNTAITLHVTKYTADGKNWVGHKTGELKSSQDYKISEDGKNIIYSHTQYTFDDLDYEAEDLEIPSEVRIGSNTYNVMLGFFAFYNCMKLTGSLTISSGIESIVDRSFDGCENLTGTLKIPSSVKSIGSGAFIACYNLTGLNISSGVEAIGSHAFDTCRNLTGTLKIPSSVKSIGPEAFMLCEKINNIDISWGEQPKTINFTNCFDNMVLIGEEGVVTYSGTGWNGVDALAWMKLDNSLDGPGLADGWTLAETTS